MLTRHLFLVLGRILIRLEILWEGKNWFLNRRVIQSQEYEMKVFQQVVEAVEN